ncbi:MAG: GNAT family N-acetyltransferase [Rhizobiaceae bacterium]
MLRIETHDRFDFSGDAYRALFDRSNATAFQHPIWLDAFYQRLPNQRGAEPLIVTLHENDRLVGLLSLIRRRKCGLALVEAHDLGVSDYAAPVLDTGARSVLESNRDLRAGIRRAIGRCDLFRIRPIRDEHIADWKLLLGGEPVALDFSAHAVALASPMDEWRKAHVDRKLSSQYLRKAKRWRKQHDVELKRLGNPNAINDAVRKLADLREGRFEGDPIQSDFVCDFYADVAVRGAASGFAETWLMSSDGETAAIVFGLTHAGSFLYVLIGADYDDFGRHSPGLQMYDGIIEDWMGRGGTSFDFTIGDESFKMQFGTEATEMSALLIPQGLAGRLAARLLARRLGVKES